MSRHFQAFFVSKSIALDRKLCCSHLKMLGGRQQCHCDELQASVPPRLHFKATLTSLCDSVLPECSRPRWQTRLAVTRIMQACLEPGGWQSAERLVHSVVKMRDAAGASLVTRSPCPLRRPKTQNRVCADIVAKDAAWARLVSHVKAGMRSCAHVCVCKFPSGVFGLSQLGLPVQPARLNWATSLRILDVEFGLDSLSE